MNGPELMRLVALVMISGGSIIAAIMLLALRRERRREQAERETMQTLALADARARKEEEAREVARREAEAKLVEQDIDALIVHVAREAGQTCQRWGPARAISVTKKEEFRS